MAEDNDHQAGLGTLAGRLGRTALGALGNRAELLAVEWRQEKARLTRLLLVCIALSFLSMLTAVLFTATIIFLFPEGARLYVAAGFTLLYLAGAAVAFFSLMSLLRQEPFAETRKQLKKDQSLLDAFE